MQKKNPVTCQLFEAKGHRVICSKTNGFKYAHGSMCTEFQVSIVFRLVRESLGNQPTN